MKYSDYRYRKIAESILRACLILGYISPKKPPGRVLCAPYITIRDMHKETQKNALNAKKVWAWCF